MANTLTVKDVAFSVGDTIRLHYSLHDKDKKKNQIFEGIVLDIKGREDNKMFTVRKVTKSNIGVERIYPVISPFIEKIEVVKKGSTKLSNVEYIRTRSRKEIKDKLYRHL